MHKDCQKIEALLFLAGEAVAYTELARLVTLPISDLSARLDELRQALEGHGLTLITTPTHVQLSTSAAVGPYLTQYLQGESQDISAAAAETLAIIAYRGPITRPEIEAIRGIDSRRMLRQLGARGLVRKVPGNTQAKYVISTEFLQHLGLTSTQALPRFEELSTHSKITEILEQSDESYL